MSRWILSIVVFAIVLASAAQTGDGDSLSPVTATTGKAVTAAAAALPTVTTEAGLRAAWTNPRTRRIDLGADIYLRDCFTGDPIRESPYPLLFDGHGHKIQQTCFEKRLLRQDGTGFLDIRNVTLTRGGSDGPGAALTSRGEIVLRNSIVKQNLAEEPGGGIFSMRRVTVFDSWIDGNLANDDGGGVYARRGGVQIYDSILSNNLVDGSGGAIGSTGDILVVRSKVDGNTTDGDGGALYTDEDGDVTVIDSTVDGSTADGPGGAIFTLDGDVAVYGSTLIGNRADDRGGAISGEDDVLVVNSTIARNLAVAHAGGGIWARGDIVLINATVTDNYAEGEGGGILAAGEMRLVTSTITRNIGSVGGDLGSAGRFTSFGSIVGPPVVEGVTGDTIPTRRSCRVYASQSDGYNVVVGDSCGLTDATDAQVTDPLLFSLEDDAAGFVLEPLPNSPARRRIPSGQCLTDVPTQLPAGQLLDNYLDWEQIMRRDALGRLRDTGQRCDVGAVESLEGGPGPGTPDPPDPPGPGPIVQGSPALSEPMPAVDPALLKRTFRDAAPDARPKRGKLAKFDRALDRQKKRLVVLRRQADRFGVLRSCLTPVGVDRLGDVRHRWGFQYDERDYTGIDLRPALVRHRGVGTADFVLLDRDTSSRCLSSAPDPNGTGADARVGATTVSTADYRPKRRITVRRLLRKLDRLEARAEQVEARADQFDQWESCLSSVPITEAGDLEQKVGYLLRAAPGTTAYAPAVDIDDTEWDDPDYQMLGFLGRDRPFTSRECGNEPGEAVDRQVGPRPARGHGHNKRRDMGDVRIGVKSLRETVEDLFEPVEEITQFDECAYTVGMKETSGYSYMGRTGRLTSTSALSFSMRGQQLADLNVLAFSGEEPPGIECNEDASGASTDE